MSHILTKNSIFNPSGVMVVLSNPTDGELEIISENGIRVSHWEYGPPGQQIFYFALSQLKSGFPFHVAYILMNHGLWCRPSNFKHTVYSIENNNLIIKTRGMLYAGQPIYCLSDAIKTTWELDHEYFSLTGNKKDEQSSVNESFV